MTTVREVATLSTSSIYTSDFGMSSCRSSQNLNGLGIYWDSNQMAQATQANPLVALSLSQESHRAVPVSRNTMEDKPLPPLPRVAFAETDLLDSESEVARMSSPGRCSERYPLCVEQRVINVKPEAQSKLEIYPLLQKPGPEHFAALDRAIIRAALRPRPLTIHHDRAPSVKTNKQGASTLSNAPLCTTGTPTETHSATRAEANHNLPVVMHWK
jgi:hypothetical protein